MIRIGAKFNHLFNGPLPTFPENLMQIRSEVFEQRLLRDKQTDKQGRKHNLFGFFAETITVDTVVVVVHGRMVTDQL